MTDIRERVARAIVDAVFQGVEPTEVLSVRSNAAWNRAADAALSACGWIKMGDDGGWSRPATNDDLMDVIRDANELIKEARLENERLACGYQELREALEFYARGGNVTDSIEDAAHGDIDLARASEALTEDCGDIARAALAKAKAEPCA